MTLVRQIAILSLVIVSSAQGAVRNMLMSYGQSRAIGIGNSSGITLTQPYSNKCLNASGFPGSPMTSFQPYLEGGYCMLGILVESPVGGAVNNTTFLDPTHAYTLIANSSGSTATPISGLMRGSTPYTNFMADVNAAVSIAASSGDTIKFVGILWVEGDSDWINGSTTYYNDNLTLWGQLNTDIKAATGQSNDIVFFVSQASGMADLAAAGGAAPMNTCPWDSYVGCIDDASGATSARSPIATWQLSRDFPAKFIMTGPAYQFDTFSGDVHQTQLGYNNLGATAAVAMKSVLVDGQNGYFAVMPKSITRSGAVITATFHTPRNLPLTLDTSTVPNPFHNGQYDTCGHGFIFYQSGSALTEATCAGGGNGGIKSVTCQGRTCTITLTATPTGSNQRLLYGFEGQYAASTRMSSCSPDATTCPNTTGTIVPWRGSTEGNVRTITDYVEINHGQQIQHWLVHFAEPIGFSWTPYSDPPLPTLPPPVLMFSDLTDGPRDGGDTSGGSTGAYVCVWGKNFGIEQGSSTISVGGVNVARYISWGPYIAQNNPTAQEYWGPTGTSWNSVAGTNDNGLDKACFQLGSSVPTGSAPIHITVGGVQDTEAWDWLNKVWVSTGLPFTVRADGTNSIYFVDGDNGSDSGGVSGHWGSPWATIQHAFGTQPLSAIVYLRGRPSNTPYDPGQIYTNPIPGGTASAWAALVGYPGELPVIGSYALVAAGDSSIIYLSSNYVTMANYMYRSGALGINTSATWLRIVGQDASALGTGISAVYNLSGSAYVTHLNAAEAPGHIMMYGNYIHDGSALEGAYVLTGWDNSNHWFTYAYADPRHSTAPDPTAFMQAYGGSSPSCSVGSAVCINSHLKSGPSWSGSRLCTVNITSSTLQFADCSSYSTPLTGILGMGTGNIVLRPSVNAQSHMIYLNYGADNLEVGWNVNAGGWQGKDGQTYTDTPGAGGNYPTDGIFAMEQPILTGTSTVINPDAPVISFVNGGSLSSRTYQVNWTYQSAPGETTPAHPLTVTVPANKLLTMTAPNRMGLNKIGGQGNFHVRFDITPVLAGHVNEGEGCLTNIVVGGGPYGPHNNNSVINLTGTTTNPIGTPPCDARNEHNDGGNQTVCNATGLTGGYAAAANLCGPWKIGDTISIDGNASLFGVWTIGDIDATHIYLDTTAPNATYTDSRLTVTRNTDYGWNMYVYPVGTPSATRDWDGWKQNASVIPAGAIWTEPSSCPGTCVSGTNIVNTTIHPPSRWGEIPGTAGTYGMDMAPYCFQHVQFHDNTFHDDATFPIAFTMQDPWMDDLKWYNNVEYHLGLASGGYGLIYGPGRNGPRPVGTSHYYNNTLYDIPNGDINSPNSAMVLIATLDGNFNMNEVPQVFVEFKDNILLGDSTFGDQYISGSTNMSILGANITGGNNIFYSGTGASQVALTAMTANLFTTDPGLVAARDVLPDFHIASGLSGAYGAGTSTPTTLDHDGINRPTGSRFDVGVFQLFGASVSPGVLGPWTITQVISQTLTGSNFGGSIAWSLTAGTPPTGLGGTCISGTTSPTCTLTGTLSAAGSFPFTITATDGTRTINTNYSGVVNPAPSVTTSGAMAAGTQGVSYSQPVTTSGGTPPLTCALFSGSLSGSGLTLNSNCTISGVAGTSATYGPLTAKATDSNGIVSVASSNFSITINASGSVSISPTTLGPYTQGISIGTVVMTATPSSCGTLTWTSSGLPAGIGGCNSVTGTTCNLTGTPTTATTYATTISVNDGTGCANSINPTVVINPINNIQTRVSGAAPFGGAINK